MNRKKILKIIIRILALIVISSLLVVFYIPNFQFRTYEMNRNYGVFFGFLSSILIFLLFWIIKDIESGKIKQFLIFTNAFLFIFSIGNLFVYSAKIDPDVQFRDSEVLYVNKQNLNEQILLQFDVNWKTNKKEYQNNYVENIWIFRIYKKYNIDTVNLEKKWKKRILKKVNI